MKPRVYIETSVVSYLTSRPSRDLVTAAHQQVTRDWWQQRGRFGLFVSQAVLAEAARGDAEASAQRTEVLRDVAVLPMTGLVADLAKLLVSGHAMPPQAAIDAVHVAVAAVNGIDYLVTWNCAHLANAELRAKIERSCLRMRLRAPTICTPEQLTKE